MKDYRFPWSWEAIDPSDHTRGVHGQVQFQKCRYPSLLSDQWLEELFLSTSLS